MYAIVENLESHENMKERKKAIVTPSFRGSTY